MIDNKRDSTITAHLATEISAKVLACHSHMTLTLTYPVERFF